VVAMGILTAGRVCANCDGAAEARPSEYVSPGVLFSFGLRRRAGFGMGFEASYDRWFHSQEATGVGGFVNGVYFFDPKFARIAAGGQVHALFVGTELGASYTTGSTEPPTGASLAPYVGAYLSVGVLMLALRGTFPFGDREAGTVSLDLGVKAPVRISGVGLLCNEGGVGL
jgi:hypothetical protein